MLTIQGQDGPGELFCNGKCNFIRENLIGPSVLLNFQHVIPCIAQFFDNGQWKVSICIQAHHRKPSRCRQSAARFHLCLPDSRTRRWQDLRRAGPGRRRESPTRSHREFGPELTAKQEFEYLQRTARLPLRPAHSQCQEKRRQCRAQSIAATLLSRPLSCRGLALELSLTLSLDLTPNTCLSTRFRSLNHWQTARLPAPLASAHKGVDLESLTHT